MSKRMHIQDLLEKAVTKLGESYKIIYNPNSSSKLTYPCILYRRHGIHKRHADNKRYYSHETYQLTIIDKRVDSPIIDVLLDNPHCRYQHEFIVDNMNHTILEITTGGTA